MGAGAGLRERQRKLVLDQKKTVQPAKANTGVPGQAAIPDLGEKSY